MAKGVNFFTEEQLYFLKETLDRELTHTEAAELFEETYPETSIDKGYITNKRIIISRSIGDFLDFVKSQFGTRSYNKWTEKEVDYLIKNCISAPPKSNNYKDIALKLQEISKISRTYKSVAIKLSRLRAIEGVGRAGQITLDSYKIHPDLQLKPDQSFDKGGYYKYDLVCAKGHEIKKEPCNWAVGCGVCSGSFVGGIPKDDHRPALVYLIYIEEIDKVKPGYTRGTGTEAIVTRFNRWPIPYDYEIIAYDQSTVTEAAEHEQWLLNNTIEYTTFEHAQEFAGYTEFRNKEVLNQLLPEYETVLDRAFKI